MFHYTLVLYIYLQTVSRMYVLSLGVKGAVHAWYYWPIMLVRGGGGGGGGNF